MKKKKYIYEEKIVGEIYSIHFYISISVMLVVFWEEVKVFLSLKWK